jgi:hypothetical protein
METQLDFGELMNRGIVARRNIWSWFILLKHRRNLEKLKLLVKMALM